MSVAITVLYGFALLPSAAYFGIAVYQFIAPCYDKLSGPAFVESFQRVDPYMRVRAPLLTLLKVGLFLALLGAQYEASATLPFRLTLLALLTALAGVVIAVKGNLPLGRRMDRWSSADPPAGWEQVRDRWLRFHSLRGVAEMVSFVLVLAAALMRGTTTRAQEVDPAGASGSPAPRRWEATVFMPLSDNQGRPFAETAWDEALEELVARFGGATLAEPQEGCWLDARRRICREPVRPVVISFTTGRLDEFRHVVRDVGKRLGQEVMYVRFEEPRVQLIAVDAGAEGHR